MLSFCFWADPADCGLSTVMPRSSMKLVVDMKKMRRNMITSMSGIRFNSIGASGWDNDRRSFIGAEVPSDSPSTTANPGTGDGEISSIFGARQLHVLRAAELGLVHHPDHQARKRVLVGLD